MAEGNILRVTLFFWIPTVLILCLLNGCAQTPQIAPAHKPDKPIVFFWCDYPHHLKNMTHYMKHVWVEEPESGKRTGNQWSQAYFLERSVLPMRPRSGRTQARNKSIDEFVRYWCSAAGEGYVGIGIDEFGTLGHLLSAKLGKALVQTKKNCPDLYIAVWHSGILTRNQAQYYREGADLVLLETYFSGSSLFQGLARHNLRIARETAIISKTVIALGINDGHPDVDRPGFGRWANTKEELERQLRWVKEIAPDTPGIAFYAPQGTPELLAEADRLAGEIFGN